jgi:hypothetical protein
MQENQERKSRPLVERNLAMVERIVTVGGSLITRFRNYCALVMQIAKEHEDAQNLLKLGAVNPMMVCPHCQTRGAVRVRNVVAKRGISGAKATGAIFTGGLSLLAVGLSRKEAVTRAHCGQCNNTWVF